MRNNYLRLIIIATIQSVVPLLLLLIITPLLINHTGAISQLQKFLQAHQIALLLTHGLFYLAIFYLWPNFIRLIVSRQNRFPDTTQIKIATTARWYLVAAMAFFELLIYWG